MKTEADGELEARIREDQLADLRTGLLFSMPISTALTVLILIVQVMSGNGFAAAIWFLVVNAINIPRLVLALRRSNRVSEERNGNLQATSRQLRFYSVLALLSGLAWSLLPFSRRDLRRLIHHSIWLFSQAFLRVRSPTAVHKPPRPSVSLRPRS